MVLHKKDTKDRNQQISSQREFVCLVVVLVVLLFFKYENPHTIVFLLREVLPQMHIVNEYQVCYCT